MKHEKVFDLMFNLDVTEEQLDFPTIHGSKIWMDECDYKKVNDTYFLFGRSYRIHSSQLQKGIHNY